MSSLAPGVIIEGERSVYRLLELIDRGGMGAVWKAIDLASDDYVAVKAPMPIPVAISKMRFEGKLLKILSHRNIVEFKDFIEPGDTPILVEEFVNGVTLDKLVLEIRKSPLKPREVKAIISSLLIALDYLHSKNIIHRDIKPKNIMIGRSADPLTVKLIDLGTAAYFNVRGVTDVVVSGGGYTAPEQFQYSALPQSDIWSAAAVAFFLATGKDPGVALGQSYHVMPSKPPDPSMFGGEADEVLRGFIAKGMAWNVLDRFLTAREALDFIDGRVRTRRYPHIEVMGVVVPIKTNSLIFGRKTRVGGKIPESTSESPAYTIIEEEEKVSVDVSGDYTYVRVSDPYRWISHHHFEIRRLPNGWCIRDLGSTNGTAVLLRTGLIPIWKGKRVPGPCYMLGDRAVILVAYGSSLRNPPYMTVVFNQGTGG